MKLVAALKPLGFLVPGIAILKVVFELLVLLLPMTVISALRKLNQRKAAIFVPFSVGVS